VVNGTSLQRNLLKKLRHTDHFLSMLNTYYFICIFFYFKREEDSMIRFGVILFLMSEVMLAAGGDFNMLAISDIQSMELRSDGRYDVVCREGTEEIVTIEQVKRNEVCGSEPSEMVAVFAREEGDFYVLCSNQNWEIATDEDIQSGNVCNGAAPTRCQGLAGGEYVYVDSNPEVGQREGFCVMKYEAKNVNGVATSRPEGTPWVNINRDLARAACEALGTDYTLITNAQWQATAREIEAVRENWSGEPSLASSSLNRGHSNGREALAADSQENLPWSVNRRTHALKNGDIIWDLAGNVGEWVYDVNNSTQGSDAYVSQNPATDKSKWGPKGDYSNKNSGEYGGLGYGWLSHADGAVLRGGSWGHGKLAGVFLAHLYFRPTNSARDLGFRCALSL